MELKVVSDDARRRLSEFGEGCVWKVCKILEAKEDCIVGDHFHKLKDEMFVLLSGEGTFISNKTRIPIQSPFSVYVNRGSHHAFELKRGSVLLGLCTELHDPKDDYKI